MKNEKHRFLPSASISGFLVVVASLGPPSDLLTKSSVIGLDSTLLPSILCSLFGSIVLRIEWSFFSCSFSLFYSFLGSDSLGHTHFFPPSL